MDKNIKFSDFFKLFFDNLISDLSCISCEIQIKQGVVIKFLLREFYKKVINEIYRILLLYLIFDDRFLCLIFKNFFFIICYEKYMFI